MNDNDEFQAHDDADFMEVESNHSPMFGLLVLGLTIAGFIILLM